MNINEITLKSSREPMPFERLKFLCYFVAGMVAEALGFAVVIVFMLCVAGVIR